MYTFEKVKQILIVDFEKAANEDPNLCYDLWCLKNNYAFFSHTFIEGLNSFLAKEKSKGFNEDDFSFYIEGSAKEIYFDITNNLSGASFSSDKFITLEHKTNLTKQQLTEAFAPTTALIAANRKLIGDEKACSEFLNSNKFFRNDPSAMFFDQETHDFVLSVIKKNEAEKKDAFFAARSELLSWATENGSELLKLRIKNDQNWNRLADSEWAYAHTIGFDVWSDAEAKEEWLVKNASLEQLKELEKAKAENPDHAIDLIRCKFMDEESVFNGEEMEDFFHKTYLRCEVKTPASTCFLFKEISDAYSK